MVASLSSDAPLLLGVDVGTSSIKAAIYSSAQARSPLAVARAGSAATSPRFGWSEANPSLMLDQVFRCIVELTDRVDAGRISAVGVTGTACGAWLVAQDGGLVRPPILWNDGRASDVVETWRSTGFLTTIFERTGNVPFSGYTLPTLAWLVEHEPDSIARAATLVFCKDWIRFALTGELGTDESDASFVPFDIRARRWDYALFDEAGIEPATRLLPEILASGHTAPLLPDQARRLGLPAGIPVALGATDIVAGLVGSGSTAPGRAVTILGTSANSSLVTNEPDFTPAGVGIMAAAPLGNYARTMVSPSGTTTLDWAASLLAGEDVPRLLALADQAEPSGDRPVLVPHLARTGSVSPVADPRARGTISGLRLDHTPADIARACVEGVAYAVADTYAGMRDAPSEIILVGGGAKSPLLLQTLADATRATVVKPVGEEFGARGAALLAAHSAGILTDAQLVTTSSDLPTEHTYVPADEPRPGQFARYQSARKATTGIWSDW